MTVLDWSDNGQFQQALRGVPQRFQHLARRYAEEVAQHVLSSCVTPGLAKSSAETTALCALDGLSLMRWYLLYSEDRALAVERAWEVDGINGLCLTMREFHQSEKSLIVAGYGKVQPAEVESRLGGMHETHQFSLVAVTHGFAAEKVVAWGDKHGVRVLSFPLNTDGNRDLSNRLTGQYYRLLDQLAPAAVCVLAADAQAMKLGACARQKGIPVVSTPFVRPEPGSDHDLEVATSGEREPGALPKIQFSALRPSGLEP